MNRTGIFFIGATGYIATAVIAGALAMKNGLCKRTGMVTELPQFAGIPLVDPASFAFGGWDIRRSSPVESARSFFRSSQLPSEIFSAIEPELAAIAGNVHHGISTNCGKAIESLSGHEHGVALPVQVRKLRREIQEFRERNSLDCVVVVNLASTEPPLEERPSHASVEGLERCIEEDHCFELRASTLYTYAAILEGCPYINFTPSNAALLPALVKLAEERGVPLMGSDGKTGETLVKSALIPMFLLRNLDVLSWEGFNILGNMDGKVLSDPENKESKIKTKDSLLPKALGYSPHSSVHIDYVPSLDDQKTAWNFIHFMGFLDTKMSLQFIWQGYDSILAAPLVLDLARLSELSKRRGEAGLMRHLASFFKAPAGVEEHLLHEQAGMLFKYAEEARQNEVHT